MANIAENIKLLQSTLPANVSLIAVSKFHPVDALMQAYNAGQRVFGESRAQELVQKASAMPSDVEWHFIGHLQTNKLKMVVPLVKMIHSIDSEKLLIAVNEEATKVNKIVNVLLEVHVAQEETKFGFSEAECHEIAESGLLDSLKNVRVCGVMGMATNTDDEDEIRVEFMKIHSIFKALKKGVMAQCEWFKEISMGMSDDWHIAIDEGSTMVRIGSSIFGVREY